MTLFRIIIAAPFILLGAGFYKLGELISGQIYTRHEDVVERNTIFHHKLHQENIINRNGGRGFRRTRRK
jgi:hypothetical protein